MEDKEDNQLCKLCNEKPRRYVCPKCNIEYCSLDCYKSTAHLDCSENFYKQCVEEMLKTQQCDPQMKQKTLDMLQRMHDNEENDDDVLRHILDNEDDIEEFDEEVELDSDDDDIEPLGKRIENIDLDDTDQLWSALTASERQEFEALVKSGEAKKLLPLWKPWWTYTAEKKLVEDLSEKSECEKAYKSDCPKIVCVPALKSTSKASPFIRFNIINAVYAYAYTALYFNNEHHSTPLDAVYVFLRTCETMRINRIYQDSLSAIENVLLEITNNQELSGDQDTVLATKEAGDAILSGPEEDNRSFYLLAALSDLHQLMSGAKKEISADKSKSTIREFKNKFQSNIDLGPTVVTKKSLALIVLKIEFYIAWLKLQSPTYDITDGEKM
ncbi:hypothetical protein TSAR_012332 [Trichomalopsis sarcophagae]|uniref:HIT-type domain-containing protein n=1 Tax=Trichomalopsis sarcophagae TaxID=543379 RepID=A0A232FHD4_9HYME|nr:hypothetical protein TSAR_012332 [Trichomalopsis sarcophagae]